MQNYRHNSNGFTLIELLTVIAIIGILAAIIIPTTGAVRTAAKKSQTKSQFSNWVASMTLFKQEYGYFPDITDGSDKLDSNKFARALTGRQLNGATITGDAMTDHFGNKKKLSFYSLADSDLNNSTSPTSLVDAFGNTDIVVFFDRNGDGVISTAALTASPSGDGVSARNVAGAETGVNLTPSIDFPIRAPVVFYSAGKGASNSDIVYSWK